jgi:hypothetical protein
MIREENTVRKVSVCAIIGIIAEGNNGEGQT